MSAIGLRLRRRRDGSLCLTDATGRVDSPDLAFPEEHDFQFDQIGRESAWFTVEGDKLTLSLANAVGVFEIVERGDRGFHVKLVSQSITKPSPVDEAKAEALAAARADVQELTTADVGEVTQAQPGQPVVEGVEG